MEISFVHWNEAQTALKHIRQTVFVEEQQVPAELEWDNADPIAVHILGQDGQRPVACARLTSDGRLGRIAVLKEYRRQGWGSRLLNAAEHFLQQKEKKRIFLHSQANSYYFYFQHGYRPVHDMFWDANIPHIRMEKIIGRPNPTTNTFLMGLDGESYSSDLAAACPVWMQIASSQSRREIDIEIKDLSHSVFNNSACLENLSVFIRQSHKTQIRILLHHEYPGLSEHPLMRLQQRLSSRFKVRCLQPTMQRENHSNHILFDYKAHLRFDLRNTFCNFDSAVSVKRHKQKFSEDWDKSKQLVEGRKLYI